jgi:hypothetical protein
VAVRHRTVGATLFVVTFEDFGEDHAPSCTAVWHVPAF